MSRWTAPPRTLVRLVVGLVLFGAGEGLLIHSALGNSPWTVLGEGLADRIGTPIGTTTIGISFCLLVLFRPLGVRPGLGTVANAVIVGVTIDLTLALLGGTSTHLALRSAEVVATILLIAVGSGLYLSTRLGPGPRDGLMTGIAARTGRSMGSIRIALELTVCVAGIALGGTFGVGTLAYALLVGPAVQRALRGTAAAEL